MPSCNCIQCAKEGRNYKKLQKEIKKEVEKEVEKEVAKEVKKELQKEIQKICMKKKQCEEDEIKCCLTINESIVEQKLNLEYIISLVDKYSEDLENYDEDVSQKVIDLTNIVLNNVIIQQHNFMQIYHATLSKICDCEIIEEKKCDILIKKIVEEQKCCLLIDVSLEEQKKQIVYIFSLIDKYLQDLIGYDDNTLQEVIDANCIILNNLIIQQVNLSKILQATLTKICDC